MNKAKNLSCVASRSKKVGVLQEGREQGFPSVYVAWWDLIVCGFLQASEGL